VKELVLAIAKTGGGSLISMLFGAIMMKIIAVYGGASGVGLWSIIKQMQQSGVMIGTANGNTALVRGIASLNGAMRFRFMKTVMLLFIVFGFLTTSVLIIFSNELAAWLKNIPAYIVMLMAIPIWVGIARSYAQGCLNGFREIGQLVKSQIAGAIAGALCAFPIALWVRDGGLSGLVWLAVITASVSFFVSLYYIKRNEGILAQIRDAPGWDAVAIREFFSIAGALSVIGVYEVLIMFAVKSVIVRNGGLDDLGLFDSSWTLGAMYVSLILGSFGTFVLPKLSSLEKLNQAAFIQRVARLTVIISVPLVVTIICVKPFVISFFYSEDFLSTMEMFRWMLIGDYLKISGWVFAMALIANRYTSALIISSILWDTGLLLSTWLCYTLGAGLEFVGFSIMVLHAIASTFCYLYVKKRVGYIPSMRFFVTWLLGLLLIIFSSILNWDSYVVNWGYSFILFFVACMISLAALESHDKKAIVKVVRRRLGK